MPKRRLPPDPEQMNDDRANLAASAIGLFQQITKTDDEDAIADLLADLMHWMDRHAPLTTFAAEVDRARRMYREETSTQ